MRLLVGQTVLQAISLYQHHEVEIEAARKEAARQEALKDLNKISYEQE
jgi:hypothetical protein